MKIKAPQSHDRLDPGTIPELRMDVEIFIASSEALYDASIS
jgi:hypothetical protein